MSIEKQDILSLIPQRWPLVMVDRLMSSDESGSSTQFLVAKDNLFVVNGEFTEPGLVENIAQTAAAGAGYSAQQQNKPVAVGYIGAIKNLEIFGLPRINDLLETEVIIGNKVFDITVITGRVTCKNELLAQCEMKIFISPIK